MYVRNATVYRLLAGITPESLSAALSCMAFAPCGATEPRSVGFASPFDDDPHLFLVAGNVMAFWLRIETRLLPARVVRDALKTALAATAERQGHPVGRKQRNELREAVTLGLLPRAFASSVFVPAWVDFSAELLAIDSASVGVCDELVATLLRGFERAELPCPKLAPWRTLMPADVALTTWVTTGDAPAGLTVDDRALLVGDDRASVRVSNAPLDTIQIQQQMTCRELALTLDDKLSFTLSASLVLRRLVHLNFVEEDDYGSVAARRAAVVTLNAGAIRAAYAAVSEALGGVAA